MYNVVYGPSIFSCISGAGQGMSSWEGIASQGDCFQKGNPGVLRNALPVSSKKAKRLQERVHERHPPKAWVFDPPALPQLLHWAEKT